MKKYDHKKLEAKWQKYWETKKTFIAKDTDKRPKKYILDMFPYPSGAGLHVGHPEGYTATDILSRYSRMKGFNVLHPMGWDAFGLPAENYAIKEGIHPQKTTQKNIKRFTQQIKSIGLSYDWSREVNTSSPEYYKWTQWLFLQLYKKGLAYKKQASVNWCPKDNTVLANEQVANGVCERCGTQVVQKKLSQWFFKITDYAEPLLHDLDKLDWPEPIKLMQRNWIGKSQGALIDFPVQGASLKISVFTTRADTLYSGTFLVLAPDHPMVEELTTPEHKARVESYVAETAKKSELERTALEKEKSGVFTGSYATNPATGDRMPIWIADFVLANYGTGAVFADAHDERDFAFAKKYSLPLKTTVRPADGSDNTQIRNLEVCFSGKGVLYDSGEFSGLSSEDAVIKIAEKFGKLTTQYKLRDWLVSRQRYWGAPIPIIYCEKCGMQPVPEKDLPVVLPTDVDFRPTGESPLKRSKKFKQVICPKCKGKAERDYDTMDTFVDSSWYYLRFADQKNKKAFADKQKMKKWLPVDMYVGGAEHAVMHLLYARFIIKALHDFKLVSFDEPFMTLKNQGLILGPDGEKMSKSKGNVINPDDVIKDFGADSLRMYEMFMGPLEDAKPWMTNGIVGVSRFLDRVWNWMNEAKGKGEKGKVKDSEKVVRAMNRLVKKVTEDIENFHFNTAISSFMETYNQIKDEPISVESLKVFLKLLYPFAPHITEELHQLLASRPGSKSASGKKSLQLERWPEYDESKLVESTAEIVIQVNGKVKGKITVPTGSDQKFVEAAALQIDQVKTITTPESIKRVIFVPNKLMNLVV
jgi:leucyl-tRNA synthetase